MNVMPTPNFASSRPFTQLALSALSAALLCLCSAQLRAEAPSAQRPDELLARVKTPSGQLEITRAQLEAWRALKERERRAQLKVARVTPLSPAQEIKELALALHHARSSALESLSESAQREVLRARDRALVWAYLKERFETSLRLETIPQRYVDLATRSNLGLYKHPPLKRGVHFLIHVAYDISVTSKPPVVTQDDYARLKPIAAALHQAIASDPPAQGSELEARLSAYQALIPEGYTLRFESLGTFPREGRFVRAFSEACFALKEGEHLTPPVESRFGVHIAWIDEHIPAKDTPNDELDADVRRRILNEVRGLELSASLNRERDQEVWVDEDYFLQAPRAQGEPGR